MTRFGRQAHYIHGLPVAGEGEERFATVDPATGETLAEVAQATPADLDRAVDSARGGQAVWAAMTAMERARETGHDAIRTAGPLHPRSSCRGRG